MNTSLNLILDGTYVSVKYCFQNGEKSSSVLYGPFKTAEQLEMFKRMLDKCTCLTVSVSFYSAEVPEMFLWNSFEGFDISASEYLGVLDSSIRNVYERNLEDIQKIKFKPCVDLTGSDGVCCDAGICGYEIYQYCNGVLCEPD